MNRKMLVSLGTVLLATAILLALLTLLAQSDPAAPQPARAAPLAAVPAVIEVAPSSAPNDLDTPIVISGTDFVVSATVLLDDTALDDVGWVSGVQLTATVPWGLDPGVYTLTVTSPGEGSGSLPNAFTVTQGIGVWNAGQLYGGEVGQVVINPITPTTVYAVSGEVGIFRSRNAGETWSLVYASDAQDLAIDPITPTTIYWGTGGLYRSDDEGDTWNWLGELVNLPYPHPTVSDTVYATRRWRWGSGDGGGLWRSTDRGQTWVTAANGLTDTAVTGLVFHPTDPMTMYLGTANGNVFRSTDAGDSWSYVAHPINYIMTLAINPRGVHELWVSNWCLDVPKYTLKSTNPEHTAWIPVGEPVGAIPLKSIDFPPLAWGDTFSDTVFGAGCMGGDLYKTTDGGDMWEQLPDARSGKNDIALHPTISNTLYAGSRFDGVLKSEDGGETFRVINQGLTAVVPKQLATVPGQPDVVYAVLDREGGIYKGTQGGANWQFLEIVESEPHNLFQVVCVDPFTPTRVYAAGGAPGHLGNGWWILVSEDSGQTWPTYTFVSTPEPYSDCHAVWPQVLRADPAYPGNLLAGINHMRFGTPLFQAGGIYRSTDHGENWTYIDVGQHISPVTDLAYDALTPTIAYAATGWCGAGSGMLRSTDSGQSWHPIGEGIPALDHVESIAVEPSDPYRVFAWSSSNSLYLSDDHGESWIPASSPVCHDVQLLFVPSEPPVLYISAMQGLYRSTDGGQSWTRAVGALGYVPIYSLAVVTATDRVILYAGTTGGVVESTAAQAWRQGDTANSTLVNAGVYRYTTRITRVYLPLAFKGYAP
jgi:photosystem II stability/assembly factor-like uncharacterized protein